MKCAWCGQVTAWKLGDDPACEPGEGCGVGIGAAELSAILGVSYSAAQWRIYHHGLRKAFLMGPSCERGRKPRASATVEHLAWLCGLSRGGLWKAARASGRTVEEEAAHRIGQLPIRGLTVRCWTLGYRESVCASSPKSCCTPKIRALRA